MRTYIEEAEDKVDEPTVNFALPIIVATSFLLSILIRAYRSYGFRKKIEKTKRKRKIQMKYQFKLEKYKGIDSLNTTKMVTRLLLLDDTNL